MLLFTGFPLAQNLPPALTRQYAVIQGGNCMNRPSINKKSIFLDGLLFLAGSVLYAVSVDMFTAPNEIAPGGLTGVGTMLNSLFGTPIGTAVLVLNIPLFIWGAVDMGWKFLGKTITATVLVSAMIDILAPFMHVYTGDKMLASIFGGIFSGTALALIFIRGGTTGGTDIVARLINRRAPQFSVGKLILLVDMVVIVAAGFIYGNLESPLYAVISIFVSTKIIDALIYGTSIGTGKMMFIISDQNEEISKEIIANISRGVTKIKSVGGYSGTERQVLLCALSRSEVYKTYDIIHRIDPRAFIIVGEAGEISGEGFAKLNKR